MPGISIPSPLDPNANLEVEIREDAAGTNPWVAANTPPRMVSRGVTFEGIGNPTMFTVNNLIGGVQLQGRRIVQGDSQAGLANRRGGTASFPLSQRFNGAGAIPPTMLNRRLRQYLFQVPVRMTLQAAGGCFEISLACGDGGVAAQGNLTGVSWAADMLVNAGRWTPRRRLVNAGALTAGTDSGISPLDPNFHLLGIRYTEGVSPTIEWLIDGQAIFSVTGDANMPTYDGPTLEPGYLPGYTMRAGVGSRFQSGDALYRVSFIG